MYHTYLHEKKAKQTVKVETYAKRNTNQHISAAELLEVRPWIYGITNTFQHLQIYDRV